MVIIAGGSGTRLWPISTPAYPKHLLKVGNDSRSMLQNTYERAKRLSDTIYVVSETGQIGHIREQLPKLAEDNLIVEPARRGTAHCIVAALARIKDVQDEDEQIVFMVADHYIRDVKGFTHTFQLAAKAAAHNGMITLIGIEPDYAATGFGYIHKGRQIDAQTLVYAVDGFKEKPEYDTAQAYLESGEYLWNSGYFVGSVHVFEDALQQHAPALFESYQKFIASECSPEVYESFESISIDYALIEKVPELLVVPATFDWMDLGSFADLSKVIGGNRDGNYVYGPDVELIDVRNTLVQNYEDKIVAVIGLDNCVVINTPHGLLVTRKDLSQKVGQIKRG